MPNGEHLYKKMNYSQRSKRMTPFPAIFTGIIMVEGTLESVNTFVHY